MGKIPKFVVEPYYKPQSSVADKVVRLNSMSQKTDPSPIRIVRVGGQPVRLAAVLQSGQATSRQITTANYLKLPSLSSNSDTENLKLLVRQSPFSVTLDKSSDNLNSVHLTQDDSSDLDDDDPNNVDIGSVGETTLQLLSQEEVEEHGLQTVTMSNDGTAGGTTIVQYTQGPDGQIFIPVHQLNSSNVMSFPRSIVVTTPSLSGSGTLQESCGEESIRKRELRLLKNKEAAKECRRKKKEYVKCLENRVAVLENQNRTLIEELKSLKELYCQKDSTS